MKEKFFDYITYEKRYSKNTIINYKRILEEYFVFLNKEGINLEDVNNKVIRNYLRMLYEKNYKPKTMCLYISSLRSFHKFLYKKSYMGTNPMLLIKNPKLEKRTPKFLTKEDLSIIFNSIDDSILGIRNKLIIEILYSTGVRVSELINIDLLDINHDEKTIKVLGKGNKERFVLYGTALEKRLKDYFLYSREDLLSEKTTTKLLLNKNGLVLTDRGVRKIIDGIVKKTSLKQNVSPHVLRHTFATYLLKNGADLRSVQELLGHESLAATQVYTHITNEQLRKVYYETHPRMDKEKLKR